MMVALRPDRPRRKRNIRIRSGQPKPLDAELFMAILNVSLKMSRAQKLFLISWLKKKI
jgi:hypothetical protein